MRHRLVKPAIFVLVLVSAISIWALPSLGVIILGITCATISGRLAFIFRRSKHAIGKDFSVVLFGECFGFLVMTAFAALAHLGFLSEVSEGVLSMMRVAVFFVGVATTLHFYVKYFDGYTKP